MQEILLPQDVKVWQARPRDALYPILYLDCLQAATVDEAERMLTEFEAKWDESYQSIGQARRRNWARITPFFDHPPDIRKVIYPTQRHRID